jgi:protein-L-isoaspartate(D-aspartate) O-methyltransferase
MYLAVMGIDLNAVADAGELRAGAGELRARMVQELAGCPTLVTPKILAAVEVVPRHLFLPEASLEQAYGLGAVVTHRDEHGVALSSASEVTTVTSMLKQLDVRPGQRVLEIGAGTGYDAALLQVLVGPRGSVTTIDILEQVADEAYEHLIAAGFMGVIVMHGDGERGVADHAPYDRILVTAGVSDLAPAWARQLRPAGLLVVPLRIRGLTRSVAFERWDGCWRSVEMRECGFLPMRGECQIAEHDLALRGETGVVVRTDGGERLDPASLDGVLDTPPVVMWTGVTSHYGAFADLDFWLAQVPGFARVLMTGGGVQAGLVRSQHEWGSMGAVDGRALAYLTTRPAAEMPNALEVGVCGYGADAADLCARLVERINAWDREMNNTDEQLWIEVHPADARDVPDGLFQVRGRYNRIVVGHARPGEHVS